MTNDLLSMFQKEVLTEDFLSNLTQQIGAESKEQTATAATSIVSTFMGAMAKNATKPGGAEALNQALERDHDGSVLNNLSGVLAMLGGNQQQAPQSSTFNGAGILQHLLGNQQNEAVSMVSKMSGLNSNQTGNLMTTLAPVIMGMLGKQKREGGLDAGGLASMLMSMVGQQRQAGNPAMDLITGLLDRDGDGNLSNEVKGMGMRILGNLFGGKK
jgi:hypothetical protein